MDRGFVQCWRPEAISIHSSSSTSSLLLSASSDPSSYSVSYPTVLVVLWLWVSQGSYHHSRVSCSTWSCWDMLAHPCVSVHPYSDDTQMSSILVALHLKSYSCLVECCLEVYFLKFNLLKTDFVFNMEAVYYGFSCMMLNIYYFRCCSISKVFSIH